MVQADSSNTTTASADPPTPRAPRASRRGLLMGLAAGATLATPAVATALSELASAPIDPIFAVLAEHRAAMKAYLPASEQSGRLEDDTPEWNAAWTVTQAAIRREHAALHAVLTTDPTTLAGAVALIEHVGQDNFLGEAPEDYDTSLLAAHAPGEGLLAPKRRTSFRRASPSRSAASSRGGRHERDHPAIQAQADRSACPPRPPR
jgi:hypothetical protein